MATIVLTGGGTLGHTTPCLALIPQLKQRFSKIYYVGSNGIEKSVCQNVLPYHEIPVVKLRRKICFSNLKIPFKLAKCVRSAQSLLQKLSPDIVFSKGGFVSLPVVLAAHRLGIPVVCHESDFSLGLTNKITARFAKKVLTTFSETAKHLKTRQCVGAPIREELLGADKNQALKKFGFDNRKPVLLVFGGSSGSKVINQATTCALDNLIGKFYVLHITGKGQKSTYKPTFGYYQTEFETDMASVYAVADICVSRAGANALNELIANKIPTLVIPLKKGVSRGDQLQNAEYFKKLGLVNVLSETDLNGLTLTDGINQTFRHREKLIENMQKYKQGNANGIIVEILAKECKKPY